MSEGGIRETLNSRAVKLFVGFIACVFIFVAIWSWVAFENVNLFPLLGLANIIYAIYFFAMLLAGLVAVALFKVLFSSRDDKA